MLATVIILVFLLIVNSLIYKTAYHPLVLQSVLWIVYYLILAFNINRYDVFLDNINPFVILQAVGFSLGGFLVVLFTKTKVKEYRQVVSTTSLEAANHNANLLYPLALLATILSVIYTIKQMGSASIMEIMNFRDELSEDDGKKMGAIGTIQLLLSVFVIIYTVAVKHAEIKLGKVKLTLLLFAFLYLTLLLGSKGMFIAFFSALGYILLYQKMVKKRTMLFFVLSLLAILFLLLFLRGGGNEAAIEKDKFAELLLTYSVTALPALYLMKEHPPLVFGYYSFRVFYIWINKLGFDFSISPVLNDFTLSPIPGNVYTYLKPYYFDFGMIGIFLMPLIIGAFHCFIYYKSTQNKVQYFFFNAMFLYPLIMQGFEENYFRQASNWAYIALVILILTKIKLNGNRSSNSNLQPQNS